MRFAFYCSVVFLLVVGSVFYGYSVGRGWTGPWKEILTLESHLASWRVHKKWGPPQLYLEKPQETGKERFSVIRKDRFLMGYRAIMGWDDSQGTHVVWLFDSEGEQIHTWTIPYEELGISKNSPFPISPHGMAVLTDGSVILNFGLGAEDLVRINPCGNIIWARKGYYHHSIDLTQKGTFWTWKGKNAIDGPFQSMIEIDVESGETVRTIELLDLIRRSSHAAAILAGVGSDFVFPGQQSDHKGFRGLPDVFHPNDVEILPAHLAQAFPMFEAGDLLISLRNRNLVAVIDKAGTTIKWWRHGPWHKQHDPDFGADGKIYVYNNNPSRGRSSIIAINPQTDEFIDLFAQGPIRYFSPSQGKHQLLPNGQIQVTVPHQGRVIEASLEGDLVFDFVNTVGDAVVARLYNAAWLASDHFETIPQCN